MKRGPLDRRITFIRLTADRDARYNTPKGHWAPFLTVMAEVQDVLPSRAERLIDDINIASRPARLRMPYRPGISSDMRVVIDGRTLQIVAGPAEIGRRDGLEMIVEELSTMGAGS